MARLFVAIRPPAEVLDVLAALPRPDEPGVRWVPPEQWHITVRFFGEADEGEAATALGRVSVLIAERGARNVSRTAVLGPAVSRLGRSVVCVPVRGIDHLAAIVHQVTADVGRPVDSRPFAGHLTLARLRHRAACGLAGARIAAQFEVHELELVRSTLGAAGATHEVVSTLAL